MVDGVTHRAAVYPGTFDPLTNGHIDLIQRATRLVDRLVIGVAVNEAKGPLFSLEERVQMVEAETRSIAAQSGVVIDVVPFRGLLVQFARGVGASIVLRGLRAVTDFDYEFQMAGMNHRLDPEIELVFLMASDGNHFISSRLVKEIARLGGDISSLVPKMVLERTLARTGTVEAKGS
ncbi:pantetheine-phosphate adenylyltransferase [Pseudoroseomonas globiformis]|uniref:Phosphopantetheine adenylyltransferase n=1 Tax=Teichococcus globiformis TaxID=2307229 RepID=A0ABV7G2L7_9PROT